MQRLSKIYYILFILVIVTAQQNPIEELRQKYISFEYNAVIIQANSLIKTGNYPSDELVHIYEMKGMSQYSLGMEDEARNSFEELLKIDPNFSMDPNRVSPKIVSFFNEIKVGYQNELDQERPMLDSLRIYRANMIQANENYKTAVVKNIILPGWGQFQMGNTTKGLVYSTLSVASAASSIYFIIKTNEKETAYLNETDTEVIDGKYDDYNSAYKTRNLLLVVTAAIWIASQADILFFTDINNVAASEMSRFSPPKDLQFGFSFPLN